MSALLTYPPGATDSGYLGPTRFCLLDLCEYASILDPMKPPSDNIFRYFPEETSDESMYQTADDLTRFGRDIAGPARAFSYLTDGLIFLILLRIGLTMNTPQSGRKNRYSRVARTLPSTILFTLLVLGLAYIGYVCDFVSWNIRNSYNYRHRDTAFQIDIACSILVLSLACLVLIYAVTTALRRHHGFSVQKFSPSQVLCVQCSALWIVRTVFYTTFACTSYRRSRLDLLDVCPDSQVWSRIGSSCGLVLVPGWYFYFLNVVFVTWPAYLILHLLMNRFDSEEMGDFFVKKDDVEFDTVSIASSDYS